MVVRMVGKEGTKVMMRAREKIHQQEVRSLVE